jgi:hypothetical protein
MSNDGKCGVISNFTLSDGTRLRCLHDFEHQGLPHSWEKLRSQNVLGGVCNASAPLPASIYAGWPLTPSKRHPGEGALTCPKCGSLDIAETILPGPRGTGPEGCWRMGDPGGIDVAICPCGERGYKKEKK